MLIFIIVTVNIYRELQIKEEKFLEHLYTYETFEETFGLKTGRVFFYNNKILFYEYRRKEIKDFLTIQEMILLAQLVQAEAGNQDLKGKRLVADVVLNRVDSEKFPNTIEEVIFQKNPVQFSVTASGAFERAVGDVSEECFEVVRMEWERENRIDSKVLYFNSIEARGKNPFKYGDHWFSY